MTSAILIFKELRYDVLTRDHTVLHVYLRMESAIVIRCYTNGLFT